MSHLTFPNENAEYRKARNTLLPEEIALRQHIEAVAVRRRALPSGGEVPDDYIFERIGENGMPEKIEMSKLLPEWPQFIRGCIQNRASLDKELPVAPRTSRPYDAEA